MLEGILLVNLAFSVVGFFFILRMWKEVKTRRDYYGEHFGIPFGQDRTQPQQVQHVPQFQQLYTAQPVQQVQQPQMSMEQLQALVNQAMAQQQPQMQANPDEGDLNRIIAAAAQASGGGA